MEGTRLGSDASTPSVRNLRKEKTLQRDHSVFEMVEEALVRQAKHLADQTGQSVERALEVVAGTEAGQRLREFANGEHCHEKARDWQASILRDRAGERLMHLFASDAIARFAAERSY